MDALDLFLKKAFEQNTMNPRMNLNMDNGTGLEGSKLVITKGLSVLLIEHTKYLSNLSNWEKYIVWRYTLGSGRINGTLIGIKDDESDYFWVKAFFSNYNWNFYGLNNIPYPFYVWRNYFQNPDSLSTAPKTFVQKVIASYTESLQQIILKAPIVPFDITVYKASTAYSPILSQSSIARNTLIPQIPFNSVTYDPQFEFNYFLAPDATCCMWELLIPKGSRCLAINPVFHAYPYEREIILPHHTTFSIQGIEQRILEYVSKESLKLQTLQNPPYVIGEVYRPIPYYYPPVQKKPIRLLKAIFTNNFL